ncbi:MAG: hypothetical protein LBQ23_03265 [Puniceicoccales bacterium]|jgi:hypothetical protein|nr:hypothetical protein [Puniceicoccales bacterium]
MDIDTSANPVNFGMPGAYHELQGQAREVTWNPRAVRQMQGIRELANRNSAELVVEERPLDERAVTLVVTGHMNGEQFVVDQVEPRNHLNPQQATIVRGSKYGRIALGIGGTLLGIILCVQDNNAVAYGSWAASLAMLWPSIESMLIDWCKAPDPALREQYEA